MYRKDEDGPYSTLLLNLKRTIDKLLFAVTMFVQIILYLDLLSLPKNHFGEQVYFF